MKIKYDFGFNKSIFKKFFLNQNQNFMKVTNSLSVIIFENSEEINPIRINSRISAMPGDTLFLNGLIPTQSINLLGKEEFKVISREISINLTGENVNEVVRYRIE